jgi:hypothetical protein
VCIFTPFFFFFLAASCCFRIPFLSSFFFVSRFPGSFLRFCLFVIPLPHQVLPAGLQVLLFCAAFACLLLSFGIHTGLGTHPSLGLLMFSILLVLASPCSVFSAIYGSIFNSLQLLSFLFSVNQHACIHHFRSLNSRWRAKNIYTDAFFIELPTQVLYIRFCF